MKDEKLDLRKMSNFKTRFYIIFNPLSFRVRERLIREEWHTEKTFQYTDGGDNVFHGFYGDYEIEIRTDAGTFRQTFRFTRDMLTPIRITLAN